MARGIFAETGSQQLSPATCIQSLIFLVQALPSTFLQSNQHGQVPYSNNLLCSTSFSITFLLVGLSTMTREQFM